MSMSFGFRSLPFDKTPEKNRLRARSNLYFMEYSKKQYAITLAIAAIIVVSLVFIKIRSQKAIAPEQYQNQSQQELPTPQEQDAPQAELPENNNIWQGTLRISDNLKKGNLLLETSDRTIYIYTSRDYSNLLDKKVKVNYQGTLDNFVLGDITAQ